ncbi:MAG: diguanylate cyclase [Verrucomicrobia bacterium]|jgi:two-component system, cell cycle response regulator|nr:diguanylate cyclase [Verrucomicrobiota bacterium]MBT7065604.1 diguanylate cyclase [Verrucomicrobiota bacterium]MBT7701435.1 diguanylate cyclase [Verrucomicrobiota bacterium]
MTDDIPPVDPATPSATCEVDAPRQILVIDDDQMVRNLVMHAMKLHGYEVLTAESAEEGDPMLQRGDIPLALVDINLPGMSGIELARRYANNNAVSIILFTGDEETYSYEQAIHEGAADFLLKPLRISELALRIKRALEHRRLQIEQAKLAVDLERLAVTDELTGLFNRRRLMERLGDEVTRAARYSRPLTLLMIDIDNFKNLNDEYGHPEGDKALTALGKLLRIDVRISDQAFRYGGEEFVILLPELQLPESMLVAERLRKVIESTSLTANPECNLTVSIGVAQHDGEESPDSLLNRADQAMYSAKASGRNQVAAHAAEATGS